MNGGRAAAEHDVFGRRVECSLECCFDYVFDKWYVVPPASCRGVGVGSTNNDGGIRGCSPKSFHASSAHGPEGPNMLRHMWWRRYSYALCDEVVCALLRTSRQKHLRPCSVEHTVMRLAPLDALHDALSNGCSALVGRCEASSVIEKLFTRSFGMDSPSVSVTASPMDASQIGRSP